MMLRRSPSLPGPTRHEEWSGHPPSTPMAAFRAWLEVRGHGAGALFGEAVRGGRVGERRLAWPLSHQATCGERISRSYLTPVPTWRVSKRWLPMGARRRWPATTVAGMRPDAEPPISYMCRFPVAGLSERRQNRTPPAHPAENQHYRLRVTMLERKLVSGCGPKRVRSLFGRMDGSKRTVRRQQFKLGSCPVVVRRLFGRPAQRADQGW
jgi:hypothetical protein